MLKVELEKENKNLKAEIQKLNRVIEQMESDTEKNQIFIAALGTINDLQKELLAR